MKKPLVIVPYRNRDNHLNLFIPNIKRLLPEADIYIVNQSDNKPFNRGKLINIGFILSKNQHDYIIIHDIDMLASSNNYIYPEEGIYHIATQCSQFNYKMPYPDYFGGVCIFKNKDFEIIEGFSNNFWGWGAEDDEIYRQIQSKNIPIKRLQTIFTSLPHTRDFNNDTYIKNVSILNQGKRELVDGLNHCDFRLLKIDYRKDYTFISVTI